LDITNHLDQSIQNTLENISQTAPLEKNTSTPNLKQFTFPNHQHKKASCSTKRLDSSEKDSWPFETFVLNGLFPIIAKYQTHHPRAIIIKGGHIDLKSLFICINDPLILAKENNKYLLRYPIIINADAHLSISDTKLYLVETTGALIINLGNLSINRSTIESATSNNKKFRGFITSWGGNLVIHSSTIKSLGFQGNLSGGISIGVRPEETNTQPTININNTYFQNNFQAIHASNASLSITKSTFKDGENSAIHALNSSVNLTHNRIFNTRIGDGIRAINISDSNINFNTISKSGRSGINIEGIKNTLDISSNTITNNAGHGVTATNLSVTVDSSITFYQNNISQNGKSGAFISDITDAIFFNNTFNQNIHYAIHFKLPHKNSGSTMTVIDNNLYFNNKGTIKTSNINTFVFYNNKFKSPPGGHRIFYGDLLPYQAGIMSHTVKNNSVLTATSQ